jgi:hypothetical protein
MHWGENSEFENFMKIVNSKPNEKYDNPQQQQGVDNTYELY